MQIFEDIEDLVMTGTAVTTGNFDGVHLGHQFLLGELVKRAKARGLSSVVVMFYPHPREVLSGGKDDLRYLSSQEEKYSVFREIGIDAVVQVPFTLELAKWSAEDFIQNILMEKLGMEFFLLGYDHRMGNPNYETNILKVSQKMSFDVQECAPFTSPLGKVSSSLVRRSLVAGDVKKASDMLGRLYTLHCVVEDGMKLGRSIGYPTANLKLQNAKQQLPSEGVYVVKVKVQGMVYGGMLMIGYRPTLNDGRGLTVEVHIFDFDEDIYQQEIQLSFLDFIRHNKRFESLALLRQQLREDEEAARAVLFPG